MKSILSLIVIQLMIVSGLFLSRQISTSKSSSLVRIHFGGSNYNRFLSTTTTSLSSSSSSFTDKDLHTKEIKYDGLHHCGIIVQNTTLSKQFYIDMFGCEDESFRRPTSLPYPGAFLRFGRSEIHLMELPNMDPITGRPEHGGRDRHVALQVNDIDLIRVNYDKRQLPYTYSQSGRRALFCRDLDGNAFEFMENKQRDE